MHFSFIRLIPIIFALTGTVHCQYSATIGTSNGTVIGTHDAEHGVDRFLGIPYAQPPVGSLRLRQAVPLNTTFNVLNATAFGPSCYGISNPNQNEDCLTLNIWRPSTGSKQLPVLVWLYGGGLVSGYTVSEVFRCFKRANDRRAATLMQPW